MLYSLSPLVRPSGQALLFRMPGLIPNGGSREPPFRILLERAKREARLPGYLTTIKTARYGAVQS